MAASRGTDPGRLDSLTFGLGSGIEGVAIGLHAKIPSEVGSDLVVQRIMTVVVGGVGDVRGALGGAGMIGGIGSVAQMA